MTKEISKDAADAAPKYVNLILECTQANDAELIVLNRARMVVFNDKEFADEVIHSSEVEQGMTEALALATQLHHPNCMMVLFSPTRAQQVLNQQSVRSKGTTLLKKLLKLHDEDPTFEEQRRALEAFISNPTAQTVSDPLELFCSEVNQALRRQTQRDKLIRAAHCTSAQPKQSTARGFKKI